MKTERIISSHLAPGYRMPESQPRVLEEPMIQDISLDARSRYANIMYDTAFKLVFGSKANRALLIELLECLIPGRKISEVTFQDKEIPGYFVGDKKTVFDLFCTSSEGDTFVVEMQLVEQRYFTDRMLPHEFDDNLREGLVSSYSVRSDYGEEREQMTDALHFVFLELERLTIDKDHPEQCRSLLEKIAFAFRHISFLGERPKEFSEEFFRHLFHSAELANMTSVQRINYDKEMHTLLDYYAQMECATEKGLEKGREEGRKEGRKEGAMDTVRQFKQGGVAEEVICRVTGLTPEEVRAL